MGKDLTEIRETIEWSMKEMARLKDHVDYQLDLRAPFAFLFNQITQDPSSGHPASRVAEDSAENPGAPLFIQEEPGYEEPAGEEPTWGQLHCITEERGEPALPQSSLTDPFQDDRGGACVPAGQAREEGDIDTRDLDIHAEPVLGAEERVAVQSGHPPPVPTTRG